MQTSLFDFSLPLDRIASTPLSPRDAARMLVIGEHLHDKIIKDLPSFLRSGDVMVFNDTKVIPARLHAIRGNAKVEILLHKKLSQQTNHWKCFAKPAKRLRSGDIIRFADDFQAEILQKYDDGQVLLSFSYEENVFWQKLEQYGAMPLPPYIHRHPLDNDDVDYQTIYAKHSGSVAAPTAGLHFTKELLEKIDDIGVKRVDITLHVGGGTFLPVKAQNTEEHIMHSEYALISKNTADSINEAKKRGGRIFAIGTTSVRTLESATDEQGIIHEFAGETDIFITPGYRFKMVDAILTNFHLPKSTLFMLTCAFGSLEIMRSAYSHAISNNYRFYSYGDACLLLPKIHH